MTLSSSLAMLQLSMRRQSWSTRSRLQTDATGLALKFAGTWSRIFTLERRRGLLTSMIFMLEVWTVLQQDVSFARQHTTNGVWAQ